MATIVFVNGTGVRGNGCDYMDGQTGLAADSGGDLMSAWDPDKLEKRVTEVADEVGKLAEAIADIGSPGQGIGVRAVGEVSVLVEGVGHDCRMPGARCRDRPGLALAGGTGVFFFAAADRKVANAPYLWVSEKGQRNGQAGTLELWEASPRSRGDCVVRQAWGGFDYRRLR